MNTLLASKRVSLPNLSIAVMEVRHAHSKMWLLVGWKSAGAGCMLEIMKKGCDVGKLVDQ